MSKTNNPNVEAERVLSDKEWLETCSYEELMEHFRYARLDNRFHNGVLGKLFSDTLNARRAELDDATVARIDAAVTLAMRIGKN